MSVSGPHDTAETAAILRCSAGFVRKMAKKHGIGYFIGGRNGYMFTDADVERFRQILTPKPAEAPRRRRRRAVA